MNNLSNFPIISTTFISSSATSNNLIWDNTTGGTIGSTSIWQPISSLPEIKLKKCRTCSHAHLAGQEVCIDNFYSGSIYPVTCGCKEYIPKDNLEYMEWKYNKKKNEVI